MVTWSGQEGGGRGRVAPVFLPLFHIEIVDPGIFGHHVPFGYAHPLARFRDGYLSPTASSPEAEAQDSWSRHEESNTGPARCVSSKRTPLPTSYQCNGHLPTY